MNWLLDTSVLAELAKAEPNAAVLAWIRGRAEEDLFLSVLALEEIEKEIAKLAPSARRAEIESWLRTELTSRFQGRLLAIDAEVAARGGSIAGAAEARGQPLPVIDCLIAATSLHHGMIVATRNARDLERCGARCVDPWHAAAER